MINGCKKPDCCNSGERHDIFRFSNYRSTPFLKGIFMSLDFNHIGHMLHNVHKEDENGNHKIAGVAYIVIGFFLTPALIGFPLMLYGVYKLFE